MEYYQLFLYYKFNKSVIDSGLDKYYNEYSKKLIQIKNSNFKIDSNDKELICASFIYAAVGCLQYFDAFSFDWIRHPDGHANRNERNINDMHLAYLESDIFTNISSIIDDCMLTQIYLAILNDQYDYMYDQYENKIKTLGPIVAYDAYKGIKLPEYYITHTEGENCYIIYRYEK